MSIALQGGVAPSPPFRAGITCESAAARSANAGFTLLEVVVALAIVGLVGVSALQTFGAELRGADQARRALPAVALAEERLGRIAMLATQQLARLPDSLSGGTFVPPFDEYRWQATSTVVVNESDLYDVAVRVEWDGRVYELRTRWYRPLPLVAASSP